jgi:hypothetical protein
MMIPTPLPYFLAGCAVVLFIIALIAWRLF